MDKRIEEFLNLLSSFDKTITITRGKSKGKQLHYFNQYREINPQYDIDNANNIRLNNLKEYLLMSNNIKYILIGEAPSYGARYTGIPMTSEKKIVEFSNIFTHSKFHCTSKKGSNEEEKTANIVWDNIKAKHEKFVIWNAFAFNANVNGSYRNPLITELVANLEILKSFLNIYSNKITNKTVTIIAVGSKAKEALNRLNQKYNLNIEYESVKHPSRYKKDFDACINNLTNKL